MSTESTGSRNHSSGSAGNGLQRGTLFDLGSDESGLSMSSIPSELPGATSLRLLHRGAEHCNRLGGFALAVSVVLLTTRRTVWGLSICRSNVETHGANLTVTNHNSYETVVQIVIPTRNRS
jgi:hypothetical protein